MMGTSHIQINDKAEGTAGLVWGNHWSAVPTVSLPLGVLSEGVTRLSLSHQKGAIARGVAGRECDKCKVTKAGLSSVSEELEKNPARCSIVSEKTEWEEG